MTTPHKTLKFNITVEEINAFNPCYPAETKLGVGWSGNLIDILKAENVSPEDKIWSVSLFAGDKINRLFAVHCARQALMLIENPDLKSLAAGDVAERFALGLATEKELTAARAAARAAAWYAARDAAWYAARDAAWSVAWAVASDAARAASSDAARVAARAAWSESSDAARDAAWSAAWAVAWSAQVDFLIQMIGDEL